MLPRSRQHRMCAGGHPVRHCHHRQSSASPLASDAERPQLAPPPLAASSPLRLVDLAPISLPSRINLAHLANLVPVMCACPSCSPSCLCSGARPRGRPVSDPSAARPPRRLRAAPRAVRGLGDLGRSWRSCSSARCLTSSQAIALQPLVTRLVAGPCPSLYNSVLVSVRVYPLAFGPSRSV